MELLQPALVREEASQTKEEAALNGLDVQGEVVGVAFVIDVES